MQFLFLSSMPSVDQIRSLELLEKLAVQGKYLNQYGSQCLTYTGDKTSADFVRLRDQVRAIYGQETQDIVDRSDITKVTGLKQSILALSSMIFTNYPSGTQNVTFGDRSWAESEDCSLHETPDFRAIAGVELLSNIILKLKYLKQYTTQLLSMDPEKKLAEYNSVVTLCKNLYNHGPFSANTTQDSGILQILWALESVRLDSSVSIGNACWPRVRTQLFMNSGHWTDHADWTQSKVFVHAGPFPPDTETGRWYFCEYDAPGQGRGAKNVQENLLADASGNLLLHDRSTPPKQESFNVNTGIYTFAPGSSNRFLTPNL